MAQQVAALMSMGGAYGSDPTAMLQAAAIQQQLLMYGGGEYILIIFLKMGEPPGGRTSRNYLGTHEQYLVWVQSTVTSKKYFSVFFVKSLLQVAK